MAGDNNGVGGVATKPTNLSVKQSENPSSVQFGALDWSRRAERMGQLSQRLSVGEAIQLSSTIDPALTMTPEAAGAWSPDQVTGIQTYLFGRNEKVTGRFDADTQSRISRHQEILRDSGYLPEGFQSNGQWDAITQEASRVYDADKRQRIQEFQLARSEPQPAGVQSTVGNPLAVAPSESAPSDVSVGALLLPAGLQTADGVGRSAVQLAAPSPTPSPAASGAALSAEMPLGVPETAANLTGSINDNSERTGLPAASRETRNGKGPQVEQGGLGFVGAVATTRVATTAAVTAKFFKNGGVAGSNQRTAAKVTALKQNVEARVGTVRTKVASAVQTSAGTVRTAVESGVQNGSAKAAETAGETGQALKTAIRTKGKAAATAVAETAKGTVQIMAEDAKALNANRDFKKVVKGGKTAVKGLYHAAKAAAPHLVEAFKTTAKTHKMAANMLRTAATTDARTAASAANGTARVAAAEVIATGKQGAAAVAPNASAVAGTVMEAAPGAATNILRGTVTGGHHGAAVSVAREVVGLAPEVAPELVAGGRTGMPYAQQMAGQVGTGVRNTADAVRNSGAGAAAAEAREGVRVIRTVGRQEAAAALARARQAAAPHLTSAQAGVQQAGHGLQRGATQVAGALAEQVGTAREQLATAREQVQTRLANRGGASGTRSAGSSAAPSTPAGTATAPAGTTAAPAGNTTGAATTTSATSTAGSSATGAASTATGTTEAVQLAQTAETAKATEAGAAAAETAAVATTGRFAGTFAKLAPAAGVVGKVAVLAAPFTGKFIWDAALLDLSQTLPDPNRSVTNKSLAVVGQTANVVSAVAGTVGALGLAVGAAGTALAALGVGAAAAVTAPAWVPVALAVAGVGAAIGLGTSLFRRFIT